MPTSTPVRRFFVQWRENFDDQHGWFTENELKKEFERFKTIEPGDGEFEMNEIKVIEGKDISKKCIEKYGSVV